MLVRVAKLVLGETRPRSFTTSPRESTSQQRRRASASDMPFRHHRGDHEVGDARRRLARAQEQHPLVGQFSAVDAQRREHAGERHGGRPLDVVVEDGDRVAVLVSRRNA